MAFFSAVIGSLVKMAIIAVAAGVGIFVGRKLRAKKDSQLGEKEA